MSQITKYKKILLLLFTFLCAISNIQAKSLNSINHNKYILRNTNLSKAGDIIQFVNPMVAAIIASNEKGLGHFAMIYGQTLGITYGAKFIGKSAKFDLGKRPYVSYRNNKYDGFPSGHTASAFAAASYVRVFGGDDRIKKSIPLYVGAIMTGYSRIHSRNHTTAQVIAGALLAEITTYINSKMSWSNNYRKTEINLTPRQTSFGIKFFF